MGLMAVERGLPYCAVHHESGVIVACCPACRSALIAFCCVQQRGSEEWGYSGWRIARRCCAEAHAGLRELLPSVLQKFLLRCQQLPSTRWITGTQVQRKSQELVEILGFLDSNATRVPWVPGYHRKYWRAYASERSVVSTCSCSFPQAAVAIPIIRCYRSKFTLISASIVLHFWQGSYKTARGFAPTATSRKTESFTGTEAQRHVPRYLVPAVPGYAYPGSRKVSWLEKDLHRQSLPAPETHTRVATARTLRKPV
eukprot:1879141-Rhodomonas_salina.2